MPCECLGIVFVSDHADGLSYYSDDKIAALLNMNQEELTCARRELLRAG